jgi:replicative DNA helicase
MNLRDPLKATVVESLGRFEELLANRGELGVMTGFHQFDEKAGGLKEGQMTVIAAESNGGKTTLALNILNAAINAGKGALLFTLEMDREEILDLLISMNAEVDRNMFNTGYFTERDQTKIGACLPKLSNLPLWIEDSPSANMAHIEKTTRALAGANAIKLVVIDYVQLISPHDERDNREQQVAKISRAIRCLAKETKLPIIVLSQLNDEGKLRESRVIAHEAHNVILVESDPEDGKMVMRVVKGRKIPRGEYQLQYKPRFCRVIDPRTPEPTTPYPND